MIGAENGLANAGPADRAAAVRLLACACIAVALGAGAVLMTRPPAVAAGPSAALAAGPKVKEQVSEAPTLPPGAQTDDLAEDDPGRHAIGGYEAATPGGLAVVPFYPDAPMTVRERARLRFDASAQADVIETLDPGRPLRVVGAVDVPRNQGGPWLQVRRGNGQVAYVQAALAADLAAWRRAQVIARQRQNEEDAAAAAAASGIEVPPAPLPPELTGGAPMVVSPPPNQP